MTSIADGSVIIQTTSRSVPSPPSWFGEVALIVEHLRKQGVLSAIGERVRFARRRFGSYEVIDFVAGFFRVSALWGRTTENLFSCVAPSTYLFLVPVQPYHH